MAEVPDFCGPLRAKERDLGVPAHSEPQAYFGDQVANLPLP
jgi:hypothetical protein